MPVYRGTLEKISGGDVVPTDPKSTTIRIHGNRVTQRSTYHRQAGYTRREFIVVGGQRITGVMLMSLYDELLVEAIGKEVALSIDTSGGRQTVIAMRTPDAGLVRPPMGKMLFAAVVTVAKFWIAAILIGLVLAFVLGAILGQFFDDAGVVVGVAIGLLIGLFWAARPFYYTVRTFRARAAIQAA